MSSFVFEEKNGNLIQKKFKELTTVMTKDKKKHVRSGLRKTATILKNAYKKEMLATDIKFSKLTFGSTVRFNRKQVYTSGGPVKIGSGKLAHIFDKGTKPRYIKTGGYRGLIVGKGYREKAEANSERQVESQMNSSLDAAIISTL